MEEPRHYLSSMGKKGDIVHTYNENMESAVYMKGNPMRKRVES